jgi:hypothetical protein
VGAFFLLAELALAMLERGSVFTYIVDFSRLS